MAKLLLGCDPEVFMYNPNSKEYVSAWGKIEGDKLNPKKVKNGAVQVDGNALEFNIEPATVMNEWLDNIESVYSQLKDMVSGYELHAYPHVSFSEKEWSSLPEDAKRLGCDPDWNAYTEKLNEVDPALGNKPERDGAGHVHFGWRKDADIADPVHFQDCLKMVKQLDWYLGSVTCFWDQDDHRRNGYGKPGSFRVKPYGVEYRYPSNVWLNTVEMRKEVFKICTKAFNDLVDGKYAPAVMVKNGYLNDPDAWALPHLKFASKGRILVYKYVEAAHLLDQPLIQQFQFKTEQKTGKVIKKAAVYGRNKKAA